MGESPVNSPRPVAQMLATRCVRTGVNTSAAAALIFVA